MNTDTGESLNDFVCITAREREFPVRPKVGDSDGNSDNSCVMIHVMLCAFGIIWELQNNNCLYEHIVHSLLVEYWKRKLMQRGNIMLVH